jgi:hypothetical protein
MILYNTLMGVCAGLALILVPILARKLYRRQPIAPEGWALTFGVVGIILTFLSAAMAVTWPLTANPPINIIFSEPNLVFGVLLLAASFFLWRQREPLALLSGANKKAADAAELHLDRVLVPVTWLIFALGLILASCSAAIFRFMLVGGAPAAEPITGLLSHMPWVENTFFGVLYGLSALGALLAPLAFRMRGSLAWKLMGWSWVIAGVLFLLFSALNYYTHIGLLVNLLQGKNYEF